MSKFKAEIIGLNGTYDVLVKEGDAVTMYAGDVKASLEAARTSAIADMDKKLAEAQSKVTEAQQAVSRLVQIREAILVAEQRPNLEVR